jgi:hypothetical protein
MPLYLALATHRALKVQEQTKATNAMVARKLQPAQKVAASAAAGYDSNLYSSRPAAEMSSVWDIAKVKR